MATQRSKQVFATGNCQHKPAAKKGGKMGKRTSGGGTGADASVLTVTGVVAVLATAFVFSQTDDWWKAVLMFFAVSVVYTLVVTADVVKAGMLVLGDLEAVVVKGMTKAYIAHRQTERDMQRQVEVTERTRILASGSIGKVRANGENQLIRVMAAAKRQHAMNEARMLRNLPEPEQIECNERYDVDVEIDGDEYD